MVSLLISFAVLIVGYLIYGRLVEKVFSPDNRLTPAITIDDGVDCVPLKKWKAFLIQLLNIAGTGPIFGALMGAVFGPIVFVWIVLGSILGGAVHDYMVGMVSSRHEGKSLAELTGIYVGKKSKWALRIFSVILLILTGTVFVTSPAALIAKLTPELFSTKFWVIVILLYYILATLIPIDKLIGKLYPLFGIILIGMASLILGGIIFNNNYIIPEIDFSDINLHAQGLSIFPYMFITVACGAISGFHATQTPMVSKCIVSEKEGRQVFYGAMICESVIALVWAAAGVAFYGSTQLLNDALISIGQSGVVYDISRNLLGSFGGILAIIGVIVCPITSGDTAFRSARLILSEIFNIDQKKLKNRLVITLPLLVVGLILSNLDFNVLWRYFSWSNQTLAMISLWISTIYLLKNCKYKYGSLLTALPTVFMASVSVSYILIADEGFKLPRNIGILCGILFALVLFVNYALMFIEKIVLAMPKFPSTKISNNVRLYCMKLKKKNIITIRNQIEEELRVNNVSKNIILKTMLVIEDYLMTIHKKNGEKRTYVQVICEVYDKEVKLILRDNGMEFDIRNLSTEDNDISEFFVKKLIDNINVQKETNSNIRYNESILIFPIDKNLVEENKVKKENKKVY